MTTHENQPALADLLVERYPYPTMTPYIVQRQLLADLIDAGNRLANVLDNGPKKTRNTGTVRAALERWDEARDRFPEIDP